eukprot:jgi/Hompol1/4818/HPOL_003902-RA
MFSKQPPSSPLLSESLFSSLAFQSLNTIAEEDESPKAGSQTTAAAPLPLRHQIAQQQEGSTRQYVRKVHLPSSSSSSSSPARSTGSGKSDARSKRGDLLPKLNLDLNLGLDDDDTFEHKPPPLPKSAVLPSKGSMLPDVSQQQPMPAIPAHFAAQAAASAQFDRRASVSHGGNGSVVDARASNKTPGWSRFFSANKKKSTDDFQSRAAPMTAALQSTSHSGSSRFAPPPAAAPSAAAAPAQTKKGTSIWSIISGKK